MPSLDSIKLRKPVHILVYGDPKTGKTRLYGELASHGFHLWVFDLENGSMTLHRSIAPEFHKNVMVYKIADSKSFPIAIETMIKIAKIPGLHKICDFHGKISCPDCIKKGLPSTEFDYSKFTDKDILVIDSLSQLVSSTYSHITKNETDDFKPDWDVWQKQASMMDRVLSFIQGAPFNVIVVSHTMDTEKDEKKTKIRPLAGTRNYSNTAGKFFDEIIYTYIESAFHRAASTTTFQKEILTGSRSGTNLEELTKEIVKDGVKSEKTLSLLPIFQNQGLV